MRESLALETDGRGKKMGGTLLFLRSIASFMPCGKDAHAPTPTPSTPQVSSPTASVSGMLLRAHIVWDMLRRAPTISPLAMVEGMATRTSQVTRSREPVTRIHDLLPPPAVLSSDAVNSINARRASSAGDAFQKYCHAGQGHWHGGCNCEPTKPPVVSSLGAWQVCTS